MAQINLILVFIFLLVLVSGCQKPPVTNDEGNINDAKYSAGDHVFSIEQDSRLRKYFVHVPSSYDSEIPIPVILNFHGGGGSPEGHAITTEMNDKADESGFIVVYPQGTRRDFNPTKQYQRFWNISEASANGLFYDEGDPIAEVNDIEFVNLFLDDLESKFTVDTKRIYATGLSNGGFLSHNLACELSNRIAAIAPVACVFFQAPETCNPSRPISVIQFNGTNDVCVKYAGGHSECGTEKLDREFISAEESAEIWGEKNKCSSTPKVTYQKGEVTCKTYSECDEDVEVTLCTIIDGGHTWPGGKNIPSIGLDFGKVTNDISANDAMWEFFQKNPLP